MLNREISIRIKENAYTVKFPNIGQIIDIESRKAALSSGQYKNLVSAGTRFSIVALDYIDMISTFTIIIPDLIKDMNIDMFSLDLDKGKELIKVYKKEVLPFMVSWLDLLEKEDEEISV